MREILFLAHRIPFPPNRGDKIRSHNLLKRIAEIAPVHVATFAEDDADMAEEVELAGVAKTYRLVHRVNPLIWAGVQSLASGKPISLHAFFDHSLAQYVRNTLETRPISTIFVFSGQMGQYVPDDFTGRVIADFVDVDSLKFENFARRPRHWGRRLFAREGRLLRNEEARIATRAEASLLVSAEEAALFSGRLTPEERDRADVRVLRNGIDSSFFDPADHTPEERIGGLPAPRLIFTGQMDYPPNIDAVVRAANEIMPLIRVKFPAASFHVVGRSPQRQVEALDGLNGTRVWGGVPDIRPWLKGADIALVPLTIGRGVQNKVLEAMAMCLPTVLSNQAATGIPAVDGTHFVVANTDAELAEAVCRLAADKVRARELGQQARRFIVGSFSWQSALAPLPDLLGGRDLLASDAD
ncbi:MAG: TIGR03087 family PEP-CTERM/XrtA system glycosyltransferase [Novosphingobium sp.]